MALPYACKIAQPLTANFRGYWNFTKDRVPSKKHILSAENSQMHLHMVGQYHYTLEQVGRRKHWTEMSNFWN